MSPTVAPIPVTLGFMPAAHAVPDPDHAGLRRAGPRASAPYGNDSVERHVCPAVDLCQDDTVRPDLRDAGFDTVDLSAFDALQAVLAAVREAGRISEGDAAGIRSALDGATLTTAGGPPLEVLHLADEGFIMRTSGPNGLSLVGPRSAGMNDHGQATSVHADQDVYGTPLVQLMDGRAPALFRHDSPDGENHDAGLMLANLWIPLQQVVQPLVLGDGRTLDRRHHQLRYGLPTGSFLERGDDMAINDIWAFLHDPSQRWFLRSDMDHRSAYVFNTLSTPHGAGTLPGEDVAERCHRSLEDAEAAVADGDAAGLGEAVAPLVGAEAGAEAPPALCRAIAPMVAVAEAAHRDPAGVCGAQAEDWLAASGAARRGVVRMSLELRMVVSLGS